MRALRGAQGRGALAAGIAGAAVVAVGVMVAVVLLPSGGAPSGDAPDARRRSGTIAGAGARPADARGTEPREERASIAGIVRDEARAPIAGARVCASLESPDLPSDLVRDPICAHTDERGGYRIEPPGDAQLVIGAAARGYLPARFEVPTGRSQFSLGASEHRWIDLELRRGGAEVTGTVADLRGGAIAGARVRVDGVMVEADAAGRFSLWTSGGEVWLFATADGYATGLHSGYAPGRFDVALTPAGALAGTVVDAAGHPVAGARVTAEADHETRSLETEVAFSNEDGRFSIGRLAPGRYVAIARTAHGYGTSAGSLRLAMGGRTDGVTVTLAEAHQIRGRVTAGTADQAPCEGASARLTDEQYDRDLAVVQEPDGTVRADGVPPGRYLVEPWCGGMRARDHYAPIVVVDRDVEATWQVDPGAAVHGRLRSARGAPVAGVMVSAELLDVPPRRRATATSIESGADGGFALSALERGRYRISAEPRRDDPAAPGNVEVVVVVGDGDHALGDLVVAEPTLIAGRVLRADGAPVVGAAVTCEGDASGRGALTEPSGDFRLAGLAPGPCRLVAAARDQPLPLAGGAPGVDVVSRAGEAVSATLVVASAGGEIRGRVVDERGAPVSDALVRLAIEQGPAPGRAEVDREVAVRTDGVFAAAGLDGASYTVRAIRPGGGEAVVRGVAVGAQVSLQLAATGEIAGTVRGAGAPALSIRLVELDEARLARTEHLTGTRGSFALRDLVPGRYRLTVRAGDREASRDVVVRAGEVAPVSLELEGLVTVIGRVIEPRSRRPVAGMEMHVDGTSVRSGAVPALMLYVTDEDGRFELRQVARGEVEIHGHHWRESGRWQSLEIRRAIARGGPAGEVIDLGELHAAPTSSDGAASASDP